MTNFFRSHWVYIFVGFILVLASGIAIAVFTGMGRLQLPIALPLLQPPETTETIPTVMPTAAPEDFAELAFSLETGGKREATETAMTIQEPLCIELAATPAQGTIPLTTNFTGYAVDENATSLLFNFSFGDGTNQTVERVTGSPDDLESQSINHTYTEAGNFRASLTVQNEKGVKSSIPCETQIQVGGIVQPNSEAEKQELALLPTKPVGSSLLTSPSATPTRVSRPTLTPTKKPSPSPTRKPTPTKTVVAVDTGADESIPAPEIPKAGSFLPTVLAGVGGIIIMLLPLLLL
ncbi:PKD domain-containing protein [Candidatus Roizmanbacteria bacterium]|nr:PKD domain-containing protein [Candidatus Roizmanbacteria bacterium]